MLKINCPVCKFYIQTSITSLEGIICNNCKALMNLNAKNYDYYNTGGQEIPNKKKRIERLKNAEQRFAIISEFLPEKKKLFIDIGAGSGEMVEIFGKYFENSIGYEHNNFLYQYWQDKKIKILNKNFNVKDLDFLNLKNNDEVIFSLSHVIEHIQNPIDFINNNLKDLNCKKIIYIEVPLYSGFEFTLNGFKSKLWYDQHQALYSIDTLKYISQSLNYKIVSYGYRSFYSDRFQKKNILKASLKNPFLFVTSLIKSRKKYSLVDNLFKNYGYIILKGQS